MNYIDNNFLLTIIITIVVFIALIIFYCIKLSKERKRIDKELNGRYRVYGGPAGEPWWNGTLPQEVKDYSTPRYVYENLDETTEPHPENGRIIGYRISPNLVIHSRVQQVKITLVSEYNKRFGGKLLDLSEIKTLISSWKAISNLRVAAGDTPLKGRYVYAIHFEALVICDIEDMTWRYYNSFEMPEKHLLILKR